MNFVPTTTADGIHDSVDTKSQLLGFTNLASVWPQQDQMQPQPTTSQDLLASSSGIDGPCSINNISNTSPQSSSSNGNNANSNDGGDAEGVWSPDIDQAFHEALQIYPPCGRRKIILSDEGKMYGRNELIARYIKIRCGKTRTRKQVSSHIQVLARKRQREHQAKVKVQQDGSANFVEMDTLPGLAHPSATSSVSPNPGPNSVESPFHSATNNNNHNSSSNSAFSSANISPNNVGGAGVTSHLFQTKNPTNISSRDPIESSTTSMHQKILETASELSNNPMVSSLVNPSSVNWPTYPLNTQNALGNFNGQLGAFHINANRPPHELYSSIFGLNQNLKTEPNNEMALLPSDTSSFHPGISSSFTTNNFTISSSKLILCGFTAYIEQNLNGSGMAEESRVEIMKIPKISDSPLETIALDCIRSKYPQLLQDLFRRGPSDAFFLVKCWANMRFNSEDQQNSLFAVDSFYEASEKFDINVSTKVCSFGNEVVEKVEIYSPIDEEEEAKCSGVWHFRLEKSPMCEYMVRFISELKKLQEPSLMNSVLENFTVLQIVTDKRSGHTLMVIAFIFEIREDGDDEISTNIYRITEQIQKVSTGPG